MRFWRCCLDEAQMLAEGTTKCAEMALELETVHRWWVLPPIQPCLLQIALLTVIFLLCRAGT